MSTITEKIKGCVSPYELMYMVDEILYHIETLEAENVALAGIQSTEDMHKTTEG